MQSTYLFGAVCPDRGTGAALVLPAYDSEAMQLHRDEGSGPADGVHFSERTLIFFVPRSRVGRVQLAEPIH